MEHGRVAEHATAAHTSHSDDLYSDLLPFHIQRLSRKRDHAACTHKNVVRIRHDADERSAVPDVESCHSQLVFAGYGLQRGNERDAQCRSSRTCSARGRALLAASLAGALARAVLALARCAHPGLGHEMHNFRAQLVVPLESASAFLGLGQTG